MPTLTMPACGRSGMLRAAPGAPHAELVPTPRFPVPVRVRGALPAPTTARPPLPVVAGPSPTPSAGPQAQGDVIVLPWPGFMAPHVRYLHTAASAPVGRAGLTLTDPHVLHAVDGAVFWSWWPEPGPTLGTLVVPAGTLARLAHDHHGDLRIAPGVYAVRRQRRQETSGRIDLVLD